MAKLTKAQLETLACCPDWSASFEVKECREEQYGARTTWWKQQDILMRLSAQGLVEYGEANATYRRTDAGTAALNAQVPHDYPC